MASHNMAAGRIKKPYLLLNGVAVILHTLSIFEKCGLIESIVIVVDRDDVDYCQVEIIDKGRFSKPIGIIPGGEERQDSVRHGLESVTEADVVVIHDGVRPFVSEEVIEGSIHEALQHGGAVVAVPVKDTVKVSGQEGKILKTLPREALWIAQTPQTFLYPLIMEAHYSAQRDGYLGTDDAVLLERLGKEVRIVPGSYDNIKITTPEDLLIAENILQNRQ